MRVFAAVPVKHLERAKTRLEGNGLDRPGLVLFMLEHVLQTLEESGCIDAISVVSPDPVVLERCLRRGVAVVRQQRGGLNAACRKAREWAAAADALLIVHADLPWLSPADVRAVVEAASGPCARGRVVLGPDRGGTGTNLLLLRPAGVEAFSFRFGAGSCSAHQEAAAAAGLEVRLARRPGIARDLDTLADLAGGGDVPTQPDLSRFLAAGVRGRTGPGPGQRGGTGDTARQGGRCSR